MKLHYFWKDLADGSHAAVNYTVHPEGISGSVRVWSRDTRVNVGRKFAVPANEVSRGESGGAEFRVNGPGETEFVIPIPEGEWNPATAA